MICDLAVDFTSYSTTQAESFEGETMSADLVSTRKVNLSKLENKNCDVASPPHNIVTKSGKSQRGEKLSKSRLS